MSVTHSFTHCCFVDLIDVTLDVDDVPSKVLDFVADVNIDVYDNLEQLIGSFLTDPKA